MQAVQGVQGVQTVACTACTRELLFVFLMNAGARAKKAERLQCYDFFEQKLPIIHLFS